MQNTNNNNILLRGGGGDDRDALLHLDPQIRAYVLIPITVAMFFVGVIRHNVSKIVQSTTVGKKIEYDGLREAQAVVRATRISQNCGYLTTKGFENDFLTLLALRQCHTFIRIIINAMRSGARCIHTIAVEKFLIVHPNVTVSIESVETRIRIPSRLRKGASVCKYVLLLD